MNLSESGQCGNSTFSRDNSRNKNFEPYEMRERFEMREKKKYFIKLKSRALVQNDKRRPSSFIQFFCLKKIAIKCSEISFSKLKSKNTILLLLKISMLFFLIEN